MQKIREWMDQDPDGAKELRRQNRSYVFFREVQLSDKDEAVGAQGVPLTPGRSIAVDKALHVYGTPFFIEGELPIESEQSKTPFHRLMIAQDTGSAIVGPGARRPLFRRRRGGREGGWPPAAHYALRHPGSEKPRSGGARTQDAAAGCKTVRENRKAVSAGRSSEGRAKRSTGAGPRRQTLSRLPAQRTPPSLAESPKTEPPQTAVATAVPLPAARPNIATGPGRTSLPSRQTLSPRPMKRPHQTPIPELSASPRRKRSLSEEERALWESVTKQAKPLRKKPRRRKGAGCFTGCGNAGRRKACGASREPPAVRQNLAQRRNLRRRRWRLSDAVSVRNCRAAGKRSTPGSTCTA